MSHICNAKRAVTRADATERGHPTTQKGAVTRALLRQTDEASAYGQAPETMSAEGPAFFQVTEPTVDWMQYVVEFADCTTMCLMPASYEACSTADVAPA
jgi:hypothetical protein